MRSLLAFLAVSVFAEMGSAQAPKELEFVPPDTFAFVTVKVSDIWDSPTLKPVRENLETLPKMLEPAVGFGEGDIDRITLIWPMFWEGSGSTDPLIAISLRKPYDKDKVAKALRLLDPRVRLAKAGTKPDLSDPPSFYVGGPGFVFPVGDRALIFAPKSFTSDSPAILSLVAALLNKPAKGPQSEALELAAKHTIVGSVRIKDAAAALKREKLPDGLAPLSDTQSLILTGDLGRTITANLRVKFANADNAKNGSEAMSKLTDLVAAELRKIQKQAPEEAKEAVGLSALFGMMIHALENAWFTKDGVEVTAKAEVELTPKRIQSLATIPSEIAASMAIAEKRRKEVLNLRQIGLGLHNYESAHEFLPNNISDKDGKPLLSWRVAILPYVDQAELFRKFKLDEPWDSEHNKKLIPQMPKLYAVPTREAPAGQTYYQVFTSPKQLEGGSPLFVQGIKRRIIDITDGSSNTIAVTEATEPVFWTKPSDLVFDPEKLPKLGNPKQDRVTMVFCDGHVQTLLRKDLTDKFLKAIITVDGGEVVTLP